MARLTFLTTALLAARAWAQIHANTVPYTDEATGIEFEAYSDDGWEDTWYRFGMALPQEGTKDVVAQILMKTREGNSGWAGAALGDRMMGKPLVVAWPYEGKVIASIRMADNKFGSPSVYQGPASMYRIEKGTWVNATHFSYTFLCRDCLGGLKIDQPSQTSMLGWAISGGTPNMAGHPGSAYFNRHSDYGKYFMGIAGARTEKYASYAAMANAVADIPPTQSTATGPPSMPPTPSASTPSRSPTPVVSGSGTPSASTPSHSPTPVASGSATPSGSPIWSTFVQPPISVPTPGSTHVPSTTPSVSVRPVSVHSSSGPGATVTVSVTVSGACPTVTVTVAPDAISTTPASTALESTTVEPTAVEPTAVESTAIGSTIVAPTAVEPTTPAPSSSAPAHSATSESSLPVCTAAPTTRRKKAKRSLRVPRRRATDYDA